MKTATILIPIVSVLCFLSSCEAGWSDEDKATYKTQCNQEASGLYKTPTQTQSYCDCNLQVIMKHYKNIDDIAANKDSAAVRKEIGDCSLKAQRVK